MVLLPRSKPNSRYLWVAAIVLSAFSAVAQPDGLVPTTWDDPDWVVVASHQVGWTPVFLRSAGCITQPDAASCYARFSSVSGPPCASEFYWKFAPNRGHASMDALQYLTPIMGGPTSFYVRNAGFCIYGIGEPQYWYPLMEPLAGPRVVASSVLHDNAPSCDSLFDADTVFLFDEGPYLYMPFYGLALGPDGPLYPNNWPWDTQPAPLRPPPADDRTFVIDKDPPNTPPMLDTVCRFRESGPIEFQIPVTRYAGPTKPDGTLLKIDDLLVNGLAGEYATLKIMAWDVDSDPTGVAGERDRVYFNDEPLTAIEAAGQGYLQGSDRSWSLTTFQISLEKVRFPDEPGVGGAPPYSADNTVRIDIDSTADRSQWCVTIDWAVLEIEVASPVFLIHGINRTGDFFQDHGFTQSLDAIGIVSSQDIVLSASDPKATALQLNARLGELVEQYGVDGVHLVCHSKGGLDARMYLENHQAKHDQQFKILSYTSLSTPHHGSVLADIAVARHAFLRNARLACDSPALAQYCYQIEWMSNLISVETSPGYRDLRTSTVDDFNWFNIPCLPTDARYHVVSADADTNGNEEIDLVPNEFEDLLADSLQLYKLYHCLPPFNTFCGPDRAQMAVNSVYQVLRIARSATVSVSATGRLTLYTVLSSAPLGNDTLVTVESGDAADLSFPSVRRRYVDADGRNHSNVADAGVANDVIVWLRDVDEDFGDLRSH